MLKLQGARARGLRAGALAMGLFALSGTMGCVAIPPALNMASLAATGASYAATGKSTTDHLISGIAERDCALHRGLGDEPVCRDHEVPETAENTLAMNEPALKGPVQITPAPTPVPVWDGKSTIGPDIRAIMARHTQAFVEANRGAQR